MTSMCMQTVSMADVIFVNVSNATMVSLYPADHWTFYAN